MKKQELIDYLENHGWNKVKLGLERTKELLFKLGNPQDKLKFIHVAGTNGKGSTCAMLMSILMEAGYKIGFYPSPYLVDFSERIQINEKNIDEKSLERIGEKVKNISDNMTTHPSYFEMVTAIGMQYFLEQKCDIVILETGMGGRLDSTNIIEKPLLSIITNIGLDHVEFLGDNIEAIAREKAGIIKQECSTVSYDNPKEVKNILIEEANKKNSEIAFASNNDIKLLSFDIDEKIGQKILYNNKEYFLSLLGLNQLNNLSVVFKAIETLKEKEIKNKKIVIEEEDIKKGLGKVKWPARFQMLSKSPLFILDGGHNAQCAKALAENISYYFKEQGITFILGMLKDKNYKEVIDEIIPFAQKVITVTPDNPRALDGKELKKVIEKKLKEINKEFVECTFYESLHEAIKESEKSEITICFGSLYLAGDVIREFNEI